MKKPHLLLIILFNFFGYWADAQDFDHYEPFLCKGNLPKEWTTLSSEKYKSEMRHESKESAKNDQRAKERFLLYQRFFTDNLLKSGKLVVNPELTDYLYKILDILLKNEPEVREKIHLYILRSPSVNALAMNDGTILICWGLLAQVENEAQLAYILSHEITHFKERHVLDQFEQQRKRKRDEVIRDWNTGRNTREEEKIARFGYAKDLEFQADSLGLTRFLETGYSTDAPEQTFEKLKYAYLPFANQIFDKSFFGGAGTTIPDKYFLKEVAKIKGEDENADDTRSSHPNLAKRKIAIQRRLAAAKKEGQGEAFLISAEEFLRLQTIARFELPQAFLHYQLYQEAFYNAYLLLEDNPGNMYLENIIAKSLNGLVKSKNDRGEKSDAERVEIDKAEGELQQVYHFFKQIPSSELNLLALNYAWKLQKKYPKNAENQELINEMFQEMVNNHYESSRDFKVDESSKDSTTNWAKKLIVPYLKDTSFTKHFDTALALKQEVEAWTKKHKKHTNEYFMKRQEKKGARLGIDNIVIVNPRYHFESVLPNDDRVFYQTENGNLDFQNLIQDVANHSKLGVKTLSLANLSANETDKFNEVTLLGEWVVEQNLGTSIGIGSQQNRINEIAKKYNTRYFLWLDVYEVRNPNLIRILLLSQVGFVSMLFPPMLPPTINAFAKNRTTLIYATLYDVETGRSMPLKRKIVNKRAGKSLLQAHIYDVFSQINAKTKSKKQ